MKIKKEWIIAGLFLLSLFLGQRNVDLTGQNKRMKRDFKSGQEELTSSRRQLTELSASNVTLKSEIKKFDEQIEALSLSLKDKEEENTELKKKASEADMDFSGLKKALMSFEEEFQKSKDIKLLDSLRQENAAFKNVNRELQKEIDLFQRQLLEIDKKYSSAQKEIGEYGRLLKEKGEELEKKKEEMVILRSNLDTAFSERDVLKVESASLKEDVKTANRATAFLNNKVSNSDKSLSDASAQLDKLKKEVESLRSHRNSLQEELSMSLTSQKQANEQFIQAMQTVSLLQNRFKGLSELLEYKSTGINTEGAEEVSLPKIKVTLPDAETESGKNEAKLSIYREELKKEAVMYYNRGLKDAGEGRHKQAVDEFLKAIEANPTDADSCYNLAIIYDDHLNNKKKAVYYYRKYLELRPDSDDRDEVMNWLKRAGYKGN
ncbi:MAG: hypothetical protein KKH08_02605 [Candidatus Omnitrophica bacterium]|nr:hypothetical protein [Candidatus Omnitrophota bacterium]